MALVAKEYRGNIADLQYYGHIAIADETGKILYKSGDPERIVYPRSSAKPMQAIAVIESGAAEKFGISEEELAVICASHRGEIFHIEAILSVLSKAGLDESYLQCGTERGRTPKEIYNNCSGKHAGMLITAKALGESLDDYYLSSHPRQKRITEIIADMCGYPEDKIITGIDGCGVPVHAMPLYKFAQGYARMSKSQARIMQAMTKYPKMSGGTGDFTSELMAKFGGRLFCKGGANAFFAVGLKNKGIGVAVKIEDGNYDILPLVITETLIQMGVIDPDEAEAREKIITNHKNEEVGKITADFVLEKL